MPSLPQGATTRQAARTDVGDELARPSGFWQRRGKLPATVFVQTLVLGWWQHPAARLGQLCQLAAVRGVAISPQGLDQRFTDAGATLLEAVLAATVARLLTSRSVAAGRLDRVAAVLVLASTTITLPDGLAPFWPGCGGRSTPPPRPRSRAPAAWTCGGAAWPGWS
jgi:hypothetical protein